VKFTLLQERKAKTRGSMRERLWGRGRGLLRYKSHDTVIVVRRASGIMGRRRGIQSATNMIEEGGPSRFSHRDTGTREERLDEGNRYKDRPSTSCSAGEKDNSIPIEKERGLLI